MKSLLVLVMSVGEYSSNWTVKWLRKIGGENNTIVCLPKQFKENATSYERNGIETYIYDESKYINKDFEFFGFKPRNCGGVGRQGIAEAVEKFATDDNVILELDDDTSQICCRKEIDGKQKSSGIKRFEDLERIVNLENDFFEKTGVDISGQTGATPPAESFVTNHKIFNNFIMRKGNRLNFYGFKALCSDDYRFNFYNNLLNCRPMISHKFLNITFHQSQGDRNDGNAPLYNSDCSWKKSMALKMVAPWAVEQRVVKETNRCLFRENISSSKLYPPISLEDNGEIRSRI